jgi:hypothetical protein
MTTFPMLLHILMIPSCTTEYDSKENVNAKYLHIKHYHRISFSETF